MSNDVSPLPACVIAALNAPKTHEVCTLYASGVEKRHQTRNLASVEMHAVLERRKIGRNLVDRMTGESVRVVSVTIRAL
jgi:hypothetical protein